ncbi:MAG: Flp pilus assembly protein CpaB [Kiritimatiellae bacterium]|nr:Flp pilus assembly protein CpaB [Kiritimatiellia bacterium]
MKRQIVLIASLVAGLVAALLTSAYISGKNDELKKKEAEMRRKYGEMNAVCFVQRKTKGSIITAEDIKPCKTIRVGNEGLVYTPDDQNMLIGRTLLTTVEANIPIRKTDIEGYSRDVGLSDQITKKFRAFSISVSGSASVSGMVRAGDEVDVIGTFMLPSDEGKNKRGDLATVTLVQKVRVLAVGDETAKTRVRSLGASSAAASGFTTVTLLVTPREVEMLAQAEQKKGSLALSLRNRNDIVTEGELPIIEFEKIREQVVELNKERNPTGRKTR